SKGLQFKYVIVPFCSWNLDHEKWQAPNLWVKSGEGPFVEAGYLPVKYTRNLEDTFFSGYYAAEKTKIHLDNLNLLYVAFTRAESGLIVYGPSPSTRGAKGTIAGLLHASIIGNDDLRSGWDEESQTWRNGSWRLDSPQETNHVGSLQLTEYLSSPWREKLVIRRTGSDWFSEDRVDPTYEKIRYGIHMHTVLSRMHFSDEMELMLDEIAREGFIGPAEREPLAQQLADLLANSKVASWFTRDWEVRTEVPILVPGGQENRIDRLLTKDRRAIVIDFKTGSRKRTDEKQVLDYMEIMRKMNYTDVEGYLLYLSENAVAEVRAGGKPRLVQRRKDKDQLDLGL
ncbi:MAG: PD-(D/E)XK nuclease family protein, partial [Bacteroidota bacterium]|nr:PD-(D/E)XK nuclease family protein [Bacteroidota bacterium]